MDATPIHLAGNNAPVSDERDAVPTHVVGRVPEDLRGMYVRNGPNPRRGWSPHLFAGDGMVHGIALEDGGAAWYRNRYVRTPLYDDPGIARGDPRVTTANTHVIEHGGRLLALEEGGLPYELTPALDTVGPFTFGGALRAPMTAHPKRCPRTGDLLFFGYQVVPPYLTYRRATSEGGLVEVRDIELAVCSMHHDFAVTDTCAVFVDSCYVFDLAALATGSPWRWDDRPARIGVLPRAGGEIRWFEIAPCHLSHAANAYDDGSAIVLTGTRIDGPAALPVMHEWGIDLGSGVVTERALDAASTEYPRVPDALVGRPNRYTYTTGFWFEAEPDHGEINRHEGDDRRTHVLPAGHTVGEPVFVPRDGATAEDDGYLLAFAHDRGAGRSYLLILDAGDVEAAPIAEVHLPLRVPGGFHGSWLPAE
jgi:carotenoid cleavage dioxygenase